MHVGVCARVASMSLFGSVTGRQAPVAHSSWSKIFPLPIPPIVANHCSPVSQVLHLRLTPQWRAYERYGVSPFLIAPCFGCRTATVFFSRLLGSLIWEVLLLTQPHTRAVRNKKTTEVSRLPRVWLRRMQRGKTPPVQSRARNNARQLFCLPHQVTESATGNG